MRLKSVGEGLRGRISSAALLVFLVSVLILCGLVALIESITGSPWILALMLVVPGVVAVAQTLVRREGAIRKELFDAMGKGKVEGRWLAISSLLFPTISLLALVIFAITGDTGLHFGTPRFILILAAVPLALCNELGWRGYAPRLLPDRYSLFSKSVIIGVFWLASVSPIYLLDVKSVVDIPLYELALALIPMSTLLFWIRANTRSLLMSALFTASGIIMVGLLPILPGDSAQSVTFWLMVGFLWLAAVIITGMYGTDGLDRTIRELPPDQLPVDWAKIMPPAENGRKTSRGRNGQAKPNRKSFSGVSRKTRR